MSVDGVIFGTLITTSTIGLLISGFLLTLIMRRKSLRQEDYIILIISRIFVDALMSLLCCTLQLAGSTQIWITDPLWCTVAGGIWNSIGATLLCLETLLAFNRYVSICHGKHYDRIFRKRNIHLMCAIAWLLGIVITVPNIVDDSLGRIPGFFCNLKFERKHFLVIASTNYGAAVVSYSTVAFCYCKIFLVLKRHQSQINDTGLESRLREDQSIMRYIGTAALVPLITEMPVAVGIAMRIYDPSLVPDLVLFASAIPYLFCPVINSTLTLFMIGPVRKEFFKALKRSSSCNQVAPSIIRVEPPRVAHLANTSAV